MILYFTDFNMNLVDLHVQAQACSCNLSHLTCPLQVPTDRSGKLYHSINLNHYATKKTAAQSMLDVALLMANSSQLKTVLYVGPQYRFYIPLIVLLSISICLQVIVGLLLVFIGKWLHHFVSKGLLFDVFRTCDIDAFNLTAQFEEVPDWI